MAEYPTNVNPVDRALADAEHADALHNADPFPPAVGTARPPCGPCDAVDWWAFSGSVRSVNAARDIFHKLGHPAGVQPPAPVGSVTPCQHGNYACPLCDAPAPAPVPDATQWFGNPPVGAPGEPPPPLNLPRPYVEVPNSGYAPFAHNLDVPRAGDFNVEATLIASAVRCCTPPGVDDPHTPTCPAYGYPPPVTRDAAPPVPPVPPVPPADVQNIPGLAEVLAWARAADERLYSDTDDALYCRAQHSESGHDVGNFYWSDVQDRAQPVQSLVAFVARHWGCTDAHG